MYELQMNLVTDWQDIIINEIKAEGIQYPDTISKEKLIIGYLEYLRKKGERKPYNIYKSREFHCPPEMEKELNHFIKVLENGEDRSPYLNKFIDDNKTGNDDMFDHWGILQVHLHAGNGGPLLLVCFKDDNAYLINVFDHKEQSKKEVLQILQNNWPELAEDLKRRRGLNHSGGAAIDTMNYLRIIKGLKIYENFLRKNTDRIIKQIRNSHIAVPPVLKYKLVKNNSLFIIIEENTGHPILNPIPNNK